MMIFPKIYRYKKRAFADDLIKFNELMLKNTKIGRELNPGPSVYRLKDSADPSSVLVTSDQKIVNMFDDSIW